MAKRDYRQAILDLLKERGEGKTICPSELLEGETKQNKAKMEDVRASARLLVRDGLIEITQSGRAVDADQIKGPIRLRLKKSDRA